MSKATFCLLFTLFFICGNAFAQDEDLKKFEVGAQVSAINISDPVSINITRANSLQSRNEIGFGSRFGYNVNRFITLEAEVNFFPRDYKAVATTLTGGRLTQALFGVKSGYRFKRVGVFGKARPGVASSGGAFVADFPNGNGTNTGNPFGFRKIRSNLLTIDVGGVFEYYPSRRTILRVDVGDTITRYPDIPFQQFGDGNSGQTIIEDVYTHRPQLSVGFGFRF